MKVIYSILLILLIPIISNSQNLATFTQVGPVKFPDNPSVQTTGMGRVSHLVYHPTDSNILFAVTASGGVFKTSNEGATWKPLCDFMPQTSFASLAINKLNPKVMYLGTGDANYNGGGLGVWKTLNGGNTWFQSSYGLGNKLVSYILMTPNDTNTLLAACSDGIYKSTDAGASWTKKTSVNTSYRDLNYQPYSNKIIYAASNTFFYRSYDNGNTWIQSTINNSITCAGIKIAVCPKDTSKLFCVVWKSGATSPFGGIYKSINNGATFTFQADTPNILGYSSSGKSMDGQGAYNLAIACDPNNSNTLYIAGINIWKSTNQGLSFTLKSPWAYGVHADKHGFLFSPFNPNKIFVYHDGGLDRSVDGGNKWTTLEDGLSASEFYKMGSSGLYNDYILGGLQDNGMDVATNKKFSTVRGGDWGGDFEFDAFDSKLLYEDGGIKRNILTHATGNIRGKNGIYKVHPLDSNVMFEGTTNLFRTKNLRTVPDTNVSWTQITNFSGLTKTIDMAYSKSSKGSFYIAFASQSLYKSLDINSNSPSFTKLSSFPYKSGEDIKQIETCDYDSNVLYIVTSQGRLLKSKDKGNSWTSLNKNLPNITLIKFLLDQKNNDSSMYACTALGVYYRNKTMNSWIAFSQGLPTIAQITDMEIMSDGSNKGRLQLSTYGRGIWQTDLYKSSLAEPIADFIIQPSSSIACAHTIILVDNSTNSPATRKWQITPNKGWNYINGTDSLSTRAEIMFGNAGTYFISLIVTNAKGTNIKTINYNYAAQTLAPNCITTTNILGGFDIGIFRFELNTIDKSSIAGNFSNEDFSCIASTMLKAGGTYTATVTNGSYNNENAKIYIDYNNNGLFTDANELVGTITSAKGRHSTTITILTNPPVLNKFIRLRIVSDFSNVTDPCGALSYGQSEDYSIWIDKGKPVITISIPKPDVSNIFTVNFIANEPITGFDASDLKISNATISGFIQKNALLYQAELKPINNGIVRIDLLANTLSDYVGNLNNVSSDSTRFFLGFKSYTFSGVSTSDSIFQTSDGGTINCRVPFGVALDSLKASYVLSDTSNAYVSSVLQTSALSKNNFKNNVSYTIQSKGGNLSKVYMVSVKANKNQDCKIISFSIKSPSASGIINQTSNGGTIFITIPFGTNVTKLIADFTLSDSAKSYIKSIPQISGNSINDFSTLIIYKVYAQDTSYSKTYYVSVVFGKNKSCDMLSFSIKSPFASGVIVPNGNLGGNISVTIPYGTSLINLVAQFATSDSAHAFINKVQQKSGINTNNFNNELIYKVIAEDTSVYKTYVVKIIIEKNSLAELISYEFVNPKIIGSITPSQQGGYVNLTVPYATDVTSLVAKFTISDSAKAYVNSMLQVSETNINNFTDTVFMVINAQNNLVSKTFKIFVESSAAIEPYNISNKIRIWPNPTQIELNLQLEALNGNADFEILNLIGQSKIEGTFNSAKFKINISSLSEGLYYLRVKRDEKVSILKFVKR